MSETRAEIIDGWSRGVADVLFGKGTSLPELQKEILKLREAGALLSPYELERYKEKVRRVALVAQRTEGWCDDGTNRALLFLGLKPINRQWSFELTATYVLRVRHGSDMAESQAKENLDARVEALRERIQYHWQSYGEGAYWEFTSDPMPFDPKLVCSTTRPDGSIWQFEVPDSALPEVFRASAWHKSYSIGIKGKGTELYVANGTTVKGLLSSQLGNVYRYSTMIDFNLLREWQDDAVMADYIKDATENAHREYAQKVRDTFPPNQPDPTDYTAPSESDWCEDCREVPH